MNAIWQRDDPFGVLASTRPVVEGARFVSIREAEAVSLAGEVARFLERGLQGAEAHFGAVRTLEEDIQLVFLEDVVNFCFWAGHDATKWAVEYPEGSAPVDGWYALTACFERGLAEGIPILDAGYLAQLSQEQAATFFRSADEAQIPLLAERQANLQEAGRVLGEKYAGHFWNVMEMAGFDTVALVPLVCAEFPSFRDVAVLDGLELHFLKRAQILAHDLSLLSDRHPGFSVAYTDRLTAMADYKLPQILRHFGVLYYAPELAAKVDGYAPLPPGSREEIEIRAATIWAVERLRERLPGRTAADIDMALWLMSQTAGSMLPYHRTRTIYY